MANKVTLKEADGTIIYPQTMVDTAEIYDGAVTADKIDWSSMAYVMKEITGTFNATSTSLNYVTGLNWTTTVAGTYLLIANGNVERYSGSSGGYPRIGIYVNGTRICYSAFQIPSGDPHQFSWTTMKIWTLAVGDVVKVGVANERATLFEGNRLIAIRIG